MGSVKKFTSLRGLRTKRSQIAAQAAVANSARVSKAPGPQLGKGIFRQRK